MEWTEVRSRSGRVGGRCGRSGSMRSISSVLPSWLGLARPCRAGLGLAGPGRDDDARCSLISGCPTVRLWEEGRDGRVPDRQPFRRNER